MASMINQKLPGFIDDKTKGFPRQIATYSMDGIAVIIGSLFGLAPLTVYIESASGIREGGRTGLTALVTAFGFLVSLFFTPLIVSIPPYATGPALVLVSGTRGLPACLTATCLSLWVRHLNLNTSTRHLLQLLTLWSLSTRAGKHATLLPVGCAYLLDFSGTLDCMQVGAMMLENLVDIDWADVRQAIPAFLTVALMPLTYSIAYGVLAGGLFLP